MSGAAKLLGLSTSTVSRSISRLEKQLGMLLVRRGQGGVVLTDAGAEYFPSCRDALQLLEEGKEALSQQLEQPIGTIRLSCPVTMARQVLAPLMRDFVGRHPSLRVDIVTYIPSRDFVPSQGTDVFFHLWPIENPGGSTRAFPLTRLGVYTSKAYARSAGVPKTPEELVEFQCIGSQGVPEFAKWKLSNSAREVHLMLNYQVMAADPGTLRMLVLDGLGISMLPVWMALEPETKEHLIRVLPDWEPAPVRLFATSLRSKFLPPKVGFLLDFLGEYIGTEADPRAVGKSASACFT